MSQTQVSSEFDRILLRHMEEWMLRETAPLELSYRQFDPMIHSTPARQPKPIRFVRLPDISRGRAL